MTTQRDKRRGSCHVEGWTTSRQRRQMVRLAPVAAAAVIIGILGTTMVRATDTVAEEARRRRAQQRPNLSGHALQFQRCAYSRQRARDEWEGCRRHQSTTSGFTTTSLPDSNNEEDHVVGVGSSCLEIKRFAIFRLCPTSGGAGEDAGDGSSCGGGNGGCEANFGEYMVDLDVYLRDVVQYYNSEQEAMCEECREVCPGTRRRMKGETDIEAEEEGRTTKIATVSPGGNVEDEDEIGKILAGNRRSFRYLQSNGASSVDCTTCVDRCQKIEMMEENNVHDAANYLGTCRPIHDSGNGTRYFAGPMCVSSGSRVKIGAFTDERCTVPANDVDVEDHLTDEGGDSIKLSSYILKRSYDTESCIPCLDQEQGGGTGNATDALGYEDSLFDVCRNLHVESFKCEADVEFSSIGGGAAAYRTSNDNVFGIKADDDGGGSSTKVTIPTAPSGTGGSPHGEGEGGTGDDVTPLPDSYVCHVIDHFLDGVAFLDFAVYDGNMFVYLPRDSTLAGGNLNGTETEGTGSLTAAKSEGGGRSVGVGVYVGVAAAATTMAAWSLEVFAAFA